MKQNRDSMIWYDFANEIHPDIHKTMQKFASQTKNKVSTCKRHITMTCKNN